MSGGLVAALLVAFVLPNALNVPQTPPQQTLEFAPVPPTDQDAPPPDTGSLSNLGMGSSNTGPAASVPDGPGPDAPPPPPPPPPPPGEEARPSTKNCVGSPPRQTEDPLSPPCVAHFDGDNGGATSPGVDASEIRVLFYFDGFADGGRMRTSRGYETVPGSQVFFDLSKPPPDDEFVYNRMLRLMQTYFNHRYQTYGRTVRFHVHYGEAWRGGEGHSPEQRQADAANGIAEIDPFAVISHAYQNADSYVAAVADAGRVVISGSNSCCGGVGRPQDFFRQFPGLLWSYEPSTEQRARMFTSYVCSKVVPHQVSFSGNDDHGEDRVLGLLRVEPGMYPDFDRYADLIREGVAACGGTIEKQASLVPCAYLCDVNGDRSIQAMADFKASGITTILWAGGNDNQYTRSAAAVDYRPEWVLAGDESTENTNLGHYMDQSVWQHARVVTTFPRVDDQALQPCAQAARETDPNSPNYDVYNFYCDFYVETRQLLTGIQVAGPKLTADAMDRGFHAIPDGPSDTPYVPACFYDPLDYSCVKDAQAQWWDPNGTDPANGQPGCYRMMEGGRRYTAGNWPPGDVEAQRAADDPCNYQGFNIVQ